MRHECVQLETVEKGHTVRLNSGGPVMTVKYKTASHVRCAFWNDKTGEMIEYDFYPEMLIVCSKDYGNWHPNL